MSTLTLSVSFIASLLALSYPLILHVLARIEDRYKSEKINSFLRSEVSWKRYRILLFTSLFLILICAFGSIPIFILPEKFGLILSISLLVILISVTSLSILLQATEELALAKERGMPFLEVRTVGGLWLIGEMRDHIIHESTYSCIWRAVRIALKFQRDDFIMHLWERSDQHITYKLSPKVIAQYTDEIKKQRERFIEFHYALGGLLFYQQRYQLISRFFRFTRSQPPQRALLPDNMEEIFRIFFVVRDPYDKEFMKIQSRYPFPDFEGIRSEDATKHWICKYIAILFIRQFSIVPHLISIKPLENPILPNIQQERKMWIENIQYFKKLVEETYSNKEVLGHFNLDYITDD